MRIIIFIAICLSIINPAYSEEDFYRQDIEKRIAPIGKVRVKDLNAANKPVAPTDVAIKKPGQGTYESHCIVCHADGIAGAPKFRNAGDWKPRLAKHNIQELVKIVTQGLNAMPPKGTCGECNDNDIKQAIEYMVPRK